MYASIQDYAIDGEDFLFQRVNEGEDRGESVHIKDSHLHDIRSPGTLLDDGLGSRAFGSGACSYYDAGGAETGEEHGGFEAKTGGCTSD